MSESGNDRIFSALFALIEWTFQVSLTAQDKATIESEVLSGWENGDRTDHELVAYLLQLHGMIWKVGPSKRDQLRQQARAIFKREFSKGEANDRGRILARLHGLLEGASRGVTGVRGTATPVPRVPHLTVPPAVTPPLAVAPPAPGPIFGGPPNPPTPVVAPPTTNLDPLNELLKLQVDENHQNQMALLKSQIEKARSEVNLKIIGNI